MKDNIQLLKDVELNLLKAVLSLGAVKSNRRQITLTRINKELMSIVNQIKKLQSDKQ